MSNDTELRKLHIKALLEDREKGWARLSSMDYIKENFPDVQGERLASLIRRLGADKALAYREELEAMPSSKLELLAYQASERDRLKLEAYKKQQELIEKQAFHEQWARKPYWRQEEAVALVLGYNNVHPDHKTDEWRDLHDLIGRAIMAGQLKHQLVPVTLLNWLHARKVNIPDGLSTAVQALQPTKPVPPTLKSEAPPRAAVLTPAVNIPGYNCTPELQVALEAAQKFWANADPARPPKKDEEILPWLRERVDSDSKANAIDLIIRPEWARAGGNKKQSKG